MKGKRKTYEPGTQKSDYSNLPRYGMQISDEKILRSLADAQKRPSFISCFEILFVTDLKAISDVPLYSAKKLFAANGIL